MGKKDEPIKKKKILLIDDETDFAKLVKKNLESIGDFEVYTADEGSQGITLAKKIKPVLILLDIMMSGVDGFGVLEKLKADVDTLHIPVIMLTARTDEESMVKAAGLYEDAYISKPVEAQDLKVKIEEVLKRGGIA